MTESILAHVFAAGRIQRIIASADGPNHASVAVMKRLGMTFVRTAMYPLGEGVEYLLHRGDALLQRQRIAIV